MQRLQLVILNRSSTYMLYLQGIEFRLEIALSSCRSRCFRSTNSSHLLSIQSQIGGIESTLTNRRNEVACLNSAMRSDILLTASMNIRLAHFTLQALTHQPKEKGSTVLTEGGKHVRVHSELVWHIYVETVL